MNVRRIVVFCAVLLTAIAAAVVLMVDSSGSSGPNPAPRVPATSGKPAEETPAARVPLDRSRSGTQPRQPTGPANAGEIGIFPADYSGPRDERVLDVYRSVSKALEKLRERVARGHPAPSASYRLARFEAIAKLIEQRRFHYLGDPHGRRPSTKTRDTRYVETQRDGLLMVFEISRGEFPRAFEDAHDLPSRKGPK